MSRDDDIAASTRNVVEQRLSELHDGIQRVTFEAARAGRYDSSAHVLSVKRTCVDAYREICRSAAVHVAEIEGEDTSRHAHTVSQILSSIQPEIIEAFGFQSQGRSSDSLMQLASAQRAELQTALDAEVEHTARDLTLGVAGGVNVKKRQQIAIDNRGGAGQFAINSSGVTQAIGRDQIASTDLAGVAAFLRELRENIAAADIPVEAREALEDSLVSIEREAGSEAPNPSRLKRMFVAAGGTAKDLGVSVVAEAIAAYMKVAGWMP